MRHPVMGGRVRRGYNTPRTNASVLLVCSISLPSSREKSRREFSHKRLGRTAGTKELHD